MKGYKVRGIALLHTKYFLIEKLRGRKYQDFLNSLPPGLKDLMKKGIMENKFYPYEFFSRLNREIVKIVGNGNKEILREIGRYSIKRAGESSFKSVFDSTDFRTFVTKIGTFTFRYYFNFGNYEIVEFDTKNKKIKVQICDIPSDELFEERLRGSLYAAAEIRKLKNVNVEIIRSITKGDSCTEYLITWD